MRPRLLPRIAGGALLALLVPTTAAWAAPAADIVGVDTAGGTLSVVVELSDVETEADSDTVAMSVNGVPVEATAERVGDDAALDQVTMLVLDTSGSMSGEKITAAKDAALGFLEGVPGAVQVGLITFDNDTRVLVEPTTDHEAVATAVDGLEVAQPGQTKLYDAVVLAAGQLSDAQVGTALVLSDGADRGSDASVDEAAAAAGDSEAVFDVVGFEVGGKQLDALTQITESSGGTVADAADADQLAAVFDQAAAAISNRYLVTGPVPAGLEGSSATVSVSMEVAGTTVSDDAIILIDESVPTFDADEYEPTPVPESSALADFASSFIWVALIGIFAALAIVIYVASSAAGRESGGGSRMRRSLAVYTMGNRGPAKEQETTVLGDTQVARSAVEFAGKVVTRRDLESVVGGKLEAAGVPLKSAEWLLIHVGIMVASGLFFMLLFGLRFLPTVLGLVLGFLGPTMYLSVKESRRVKAFMAALPDTLQLMAGSLSAGYSMPQAVDTVVREGKPPISSEFNRALVETRLGVPLEDALDGIAIRMRSKDFSWVVMAIKIQREVGGNLAEVLTTVAATLRERERLRRQVDVLSAEGRLSAWILGLLPIVFALYLVLVRPGYLAPMIETFFGWVMIGGGVLLMAIGALWLRKVVKVEV